MGAIRNIVDISQAFRGNDFGTRGGDVSLGRRVPRCLLATEQLGGRFVSGWRDEPVTSHQTTGFGRQGDELTGW